MYLDHFGLNSFPFSLKPDPRFLYLSKSHSRAKAYMDYAVCSQDGFAVITGPIGTGKTTLVHHLLSRLDENVVVAKIHQTQLDDIQFLQALLVKFGIEAFNASKVELQTLINKYLVDQHAQGHQVVLIVDEAQHLSPTVLEEIRFLAGVEIGFEEVLNVILVGHPEFNDTLDSPRMEQLAQRVRLRLQIRGLPEDEIKSYIGHRLVTAGGKPSIFDLSTIPLIHRYTGGVPRLINSLCDTAMISAYANDAQEVTPELIMAAVEELRWTPREEEAIGETARVQQAESSTARESAPHKETAKSEQTPTTKKIGSTKNVRTLKRTSAADRPSAKKPLVAETSGRSAQRRAAPTGGNTTTKSQSLNGTPVAKLVLHSGGKNIGQFLIDRKRITIGRSRSNDIVIKDIGVSRHHAEIITRSKISVVEDLSSANGTYVNSRKIQVFSLCEGDVIKIGKHRLLYSLEFDSSVNAEGNIVRMPPR